MSNSHTQRLRPFMICLLLVILIFVALYKPFIFDGKMYTYTDVGSDTTYQYLPFYVQETEILRNGDGDGYKLQAGLGRYVSGLLTKYLNPGNIAVLMFGAENLHVGILVATCLQYVMICGFSLLYFLPN